MSMITLSSHDVLARLTTIKNYLAVVIEEAQEQKATRMVEFLQRANEENEKLIHEIRMKAVESRQAEMFGRNGFASL